ncbi:MAG: MFS transporter [Frankiaceae bacterium]|nr:MFS transporter [Frankiaceae bacterium]
MSTTDALRNRTSAASQRMRQNNGVVLGVILVCQVMVIIDGTVVNIALPAIRESLNFSAENLSWVINAYTLSFGGLLLLGARAGDIIGRRCTFIAGVAVFTVASLVGGFAHNAAELLIARSAQGIGGAFASPAALSLLMSRFSDGPERTRAIGLYTAVTVGGSAAGLIVGGILVEWVSWRWVMFINVPIGVIELALARLAITETERHGGTFDLLGAITSTGGMAAVVYGLVRAATDGWSDPATTVSFVVGVTLLVAFIRIERRAESPITPLRLFADRARATAYVVRLFLVAGMTGTFFFFSQYLQNVLDYSPLRNGVAFLPIAILLFVSSQASSRALVERFGAKPLMIIGISLTSLGTLAATRLTTDSGYGPVLLTLCLCGVGNGLGFVPLTSAALSRVRPEESGAASGLVNVMQQVGGSLGLAILITIFGTTTRHASAGGRGGQALANDIFVLGMHRAFEMSTLLVATSVLLIIFVMGPVSLAAPARREDRLTEDLETAGALSATASE